MPKRLQRNYQSSFTPSYLNLSTRQLAQRTERAFEMLKGCCLCPRHCGVDRTASERGFCRTADRAVVSSWGPHFGEEPPLVGWGGSGTIFFTHCNLGCLYCQNYSISHLGEGQEVSAERLASIMVSLQQMGCHNINLVTPTHQVPMILQALTIAVEQRLTVPIVYNSGGYESLETLRLLDGIVDIYMPDFKYSDNSIASKFSLAEDYPQRAKEAIKEMYRQVGDLVINADGLAERGLLVRHLVLPGGLAGTEEVMRFLAEEISPDTYVNIMDQYHPCYKAFDLPPLDRRPSPSEFQQALQIARKAGLRRIYY